MLVVKVMDTPPGCCEATGTLRRNAHAPGKIGRLGKKKDSR